jgi:hypothetical protein
MITLLGWLGAALVLASYAQSNTVRLRQINLLASVAMLTFNTTLHIWPSAVLELALAVVNVRRLTQLRHAAGPRVVEPAMSAVPAFAAACNRATMAGQHRVTRRAHNGGRPHRKCSGTGIGERTVEFRIEGTRRHRWMRVRRAMWVSALVGALAAAAIRSG